MDFRLTEEQELLRRTVRDFAERQQADKLRIKLIGELEQALNEIKTLRGLLPVCAWCKKIRDDKGYWLHLESYLRAHTQAEVTHGMCPECLRERLDGLW